MKRQLLNNIAMTLCKENAQPLETAPASYAVLMPPMPFYIDELPVPPVITPTGNLRMEIRPAVANLHSNLGAVTPCWVYREHHAPHRAAEIPLGPTLVVQRGQPLVVEWINALKKLDGTPGSHPVVAVTNLPKYVSCGVPAEGLNSGPDKQVPENLFGFTAGVHDHTALTIPPWTVVHLHGGRTGADSDGWTDNCCYAGQSQLTAYNNLQPGTMLWYHDHAMGITRLNVYAGLAGVYLIRDEREAELKLPVHGADDQERHEIPLVIQDRTLTCEGDHGGHSSGGRLLHKTGLNTDTVLTDPDTGKTVELAPMEFFGPVTMVNGKIWPRLKVDGGVVRLRILNGSNARTYRLQFTDSAGTPVEVPMQQIGCDGGLLFKPLDLRSSDCLDGIPVSDRGVLTLAPAERIDLLVDFRDFAEKKIELRNSASSPFKQLASDYCVDGETSDSGDVDANNADDCYEKFLPFPQVMQFAVGKALAIHHFVPPGTEMLASAKPWTLEAVDPDGSLRKNARRIALVEEGGMLLLKEMAGSTSGSPRHGNGLLTLTPAGSAAPSYYELQPSGFLDPTRIVSVDGGMEIWEIYNLSEDTHPFHIHLVQFKLLHRQGLAKVDSYKQSCDPRLIDYSTAPTSSIKILHRGETGWKDTIRVNPREIVTLAVPFRNYADSESDPTKGVRLDFTGRYMYHCHVLEHEDHEMMRPFIVRPPEVNSHMGHSMTDMPE